MFEEIDLRQNNNLQQRSGYHFMAPFPTLINYSGGPRMPMSVRLYRSDMGFSERLLERLHMTRPLSSEEIAEFGVHETTIRAVIELFVVSELPVSITSHSETPYFAYIPRSGSRNTIQTTPLDHGEFIWRIEEDTYPPIEEEGRMHEYTILDLISPRSILRVSGVTGIFVETADGVRRYEDGDYIVVIDVPFALRVGAMNFDIESLQLSDASQILANLFFIPQQSAPRSVVASIRSSESIERRARRYHALNPSVIVEWDIPEQGEMMAMMAMPPVPQNAGMHIFGPIRSAEIVGAEGDVMIGSQPQPTVSAPSRFEFELQQSASSYTGVMPIRIEGNTSYMSSEYAALGQVTINGDNISNIFNAIRGVWTQVFNLGALIGGMGWALYFFTSFKSRPRFPT